MVPVVLLLPIVGVAVLLYEWTAVRREAREADKFIRDHGRQAESTQAAARSSNAALG